MTAGRNNPEAAGRLVALDHIQLAMPEGAEAAARGFYGGLLGLQRRASLETR